MQQNFEEQWQNLTLADDFLFGKVMRDAELCTEMLRRILPEVDIGKIKFLQTQKSSRHTLDTRGIRLDVFGNSDNRKIFDCEIQTEMKKDFSKRSRAYHIVVGLDALNKKSLKKSGSYKDLPDAFVIFICTFDPFGYGRHIYTFTNICNEDKNLKLGDGAFTIFLNTEGKMDDVTPELKNFLDFVAGRKTNGDSFIDKLDEKLQEAKQNAKWRQEYMLLLMREQEKFAEGYAEGEEQGRKQGREQERQSIFEKLVASGIDKVKAALITGINLS